MAVVLSVEALDWSLRHHRRYGDTDLFPRAFEFLVAESNWPDLRGHLAKIDLSTYEWRKGRSLLVMKDQVSFRRATQFDPIDSILFAALIWTVAPTIESKRTPRSNNVSFSYRFEPSSTGQLFAPGKAKQAFWTYTVEAWTGMEKPWLLTTDIVDFYNQIKHTYLRRELEHVLRQDYADILMNAITAVQGSSEIGVPVGPHSAHLMAELVLAQFDEFMLDEGYKLFRFVDDIHIVCKTQDAARQALYKVADYMHTHFQLSLSRHKTQILTEKDMRAYARTALGAREVGEGDGPRSRIDELVDEHTSAGEDEEVDLSSLDEEAQTYFERANLVATLHELIASDSQIKLRKYLRSLSHLHAPGAVDWVCDNIPNMLPALPQALEYLLNALPRYEGDKGHVLEKLLSTLDLPIVSMSEHMQTLILATFVQFPYILDFATVAPHFHTVRPAARREIVLLAGKLSKQAWLRNLMATGEVTDPWMLRALIEAGRCLPQAELEGLRRKANDLFGFAWLLDDPTCHDEQFASLPLLDPSVVVAAASQNVSVVVSAGDTSVIGEALKNVYGGSVCGVSNNKVTLVGVDLERLLRDAEAGRLDGNGADPDVLEIMLTNGECMYEKLPEVVVRPQAERDISIEALNDALRGVDVLIVTSAEIERRAVLSQLTPMTDDQRLLVGSRGNVSYRIGQFGRYAAAHVHTTQGPDGRSGATLSLQEALSGLNVKACFLIGIAFGFDRHSQRLGDVLVAEAIQPYEHGKVQGSSQTFSARGAFMQCGTKLSDRFRNRMDGWVQNRATSRVSLQQGTVLSGAKLVNSKPFRDQLLNHFSHLKPIGGEMEGSAAYAAAQLRPVEVILVKGICDWADGTKSDRAQPFAMKMAVDACHYLLSLPDILFDLGATDLDLRVAASNDLPDVSQGLAEPQSHVSEFDSEIPF